METSASRRTKIIATLGPATDSPEMLGKMMEAGVAIFRLNMSHAKYDWVRRVVKDARAAAAEQGRFIGIMMDTQGPAIRTGDVPAPLELKPGETFTLTVCGATCEGTKSTSVNYDNFINDIAVDDIVLLDNGVIQMKVLAKREHMAECQVLTEGTLGSRRHINLPGVKVSLPALTQKDIEDVKLGLELQVDFIALSFVREAGDLKQLRQLFTGPGPHPQVIAKIEAQQAVSEFEEIAHEADGLLIARGDLGIEVPFEELPIIQRRSIKTCLRIGKPVIVATHMLESMINSPMPTRAEVTDVANAVYEQTDAIMLSGETTVGKYPLKCVEVFDRVARRIERSGGVNFAEQALLTTQRQKLVKSAVVMANELRAKAILVFTRHGHMARYVSWMRPRFSPIHAFCGNQDVAESLTLSWGVEPHVVAFDRHNPEKTIETGLKLLLDRGRILSGDTVVIISSIAAGDKSVDAVQMRVA